MNSTVQSTRRALSRLALQANSCLGTIHEKYSTVQYSTVQDQRNDLEKGRKERPGASYDLHRGVT